VLHLRKGFSEFKVGDIVWQFSASVRDPSNPEDWGRPVSKGERANDVLLQAVTGQGRKGRTLLRIRLTGGARAEVARRIYRAARKGSDPGLMTNDWLGFVPGRSAIDRDRRGVDWL
jgi:hypothetical protein